MQQQGENHMSLCCLWIHL